MNFNQTVNEDARSAAGADGATSVAATGTIPGAGGATSIVPGETVLTVSDLRVRFTGGGRTVHAVNGLSYQLQKGRTLAIIGESGSGKSVSVRALMGLLPPSAQVSGSARIGGTEVVGLPDREMRELRGNDIAMVFQDPSRSLNPTMKIGLQIIEAVCAHEKMERRQAVERGIELLRLVRLPVPERRFHEYPHQLSGGMRQRVMIAIALAGNPQVLIADEATSALDVTTQAQIMELLLDLQQRLGMAVLLISHDIGLAASYADDVLVMYAGRAVEFGPTEMLFANVQMPYTQALLGSVPQLTTPAHTLLPVIPGQPPDLSAVPSGCAFRPRCGSATEQCATFPALAEHQPGHWWACWHPIGAGDGGSK